MKVIVVGAGIAGCSVARILRNEGHEAVLVSQGTPHSLAATAILRKSYHTKHLGEPEHFQKSLELYREWGIPLSVGGVVTSYRNLEPRADKDWTFINPGAPLFAPDIVGTARDVTATSVRVDGIQLTGDAVVVAAGALGELSSTVGTVTWGVTWVRDDGDSRAASGTAVHHFAPYKTLIVHKNGDHVRLGSSSTRDQESAIVQGRKMLVLASELGLITSPEGWEMLLGARRHTKTNMWRSKGVWHLGGFHRTGYAIAPSVASLLVTTLLTQE